MESSVQSCKQASPRDGTWQGRAGKRLSCRRSHLATRSYRVNGIVLLHDDLTGEWMYNGCRFQIQTEIPVQISLKEVFMKVFQFRHFCLPLLIFGSMLLTSLYWLRAILLLPLHLRWQRKSPESLRSMAASSSTITTGCAIRKIQTSELIWKPKTPTPMR